MSEVFISYARSTERQAQRMAEGLKTLGYDVWLDDQIPAHRAYAEVIEERLAAAKAVVVIWCAEAARSQWVFSEANRAREDGKLIQVSLDDARLPMPFDTIQCADMTGWSGAPEGAGWRKMVASLATLTRDGAASAVPDTPPPAPRLTTTPSIAVVPFANLSSDPEQAYFVSGMVEEIVSSLARFKFLTVISAGSNLLASGREVSPQEASKQLGVRYVLEGSVRRSGNRVRIAVHLVDATTGAEVWADRFDDTMDDIFALQDRVAERVAGVIEPTVKDADVRRLGARATTNLTSYDLYLRSVTLFQVSRKAEMQASIAFLKQAISLDADYALALSQMAVCARQMIDHGWSDDPEADRREGVECAERAARVGFDDARVLAQAAAGFSGLDPNLDRALALVDRALTINPASAFAWLISGSIRLRAGLPEKAAEHLETSIRLDPISTSSNAFARMYLASARFQQGRYPEALALFDTTGVRVPLSYAILAALHGHLGNPGPAREALEDFKAHYSGTIEDAGRIWFPQERYRGPLLEGVEKARTLAAGA